MLNACGQTLTHTHTHIPRTQVSYVRKCPRLLFHEEEEQLIVDEQSSHQLPLDRQSLQHDTNDLDINHSDQPADGSAAAPEADSLLDDTAGASSSSSSSERQQNNQLAQNSSNSTALDRLVVRKQEWYSQYLKLSICPEIGLSKQDFKCADCQVVINFANSRICDYDGLYYCHTCHWNDLERTPARVLHNWDHSAKPVSRRSLQIITFIRRQPILFEVRGFNVMLYGLVDELREIKVRFTLIAVI